LSPSAGVRLGNRSRGPRLFQDARLRARRMICAIGVVPARGCLSTTLAATWALIAETTRHEVTQQRVARGVLVSSGMKPEKPTQRDSRRGEGERPARRYNQKLREIVAGSKVDPGARGTQAYVELEAARCGRRPGRGPQVSLDDMVARNRPLFQRILSRLLGGLRIFSRRRARVRRHQPRFSRLRARFRKLRARVGRR
jgi:hypothetical protein